MSGATKPGKEAKVVPQENNDDTSLAGDDTSIMDDELLLAKAPMNTNIRARIWKKWLRRVVRILFLFATLVIVFSVFYVYFVQVRLDETLNLSGSSITITVRDCKVKLTQKTSVSSGKVEAKVQAYDKDTLQSSSDSITVRNPWRDIEACEVNLAVQGSFPATEFVCEHKCWIEQETEELDFTGQLKAESKQDGGVVKEGRLKMKKVKAPSVSILFVGTVTFEDLETASGGTIDVKEGDLWVQSEQDADLTWNTRESGAYCMAGEVAVSSKDPLCTWSKLVITNETQYDVKSCEGQTKVCNSAICSSTSYSVSVKNGGIYWNRLSSGALPENYSLVQGDTTFALDFASRIDIEDIKNSTLSLDIKKDILVVMDQPGVNEDYGKWLFSTNIAYAQLKPWWLGLVSLSLLVPETRTMNVRMVPYFCPLTGPRTTEEDLGKVWNVIYEEYGAEEYHEVIWMEKSSDKDDWYSFSQNAELEYSMSLIKLTENPYLLAALIISCVLGLAGGLGGGVGAYFGLTYMATKYYEAMEHSRRYNMCKGTVESRNKEEMSPEEILELEEDPSEHEVSEEEDENQVEEKEFDSLPPPYAVPDIFIMQMRKSKVNSLSVFLKEIVEPVTENEDTPLQLIKLVNFKELYEGFCFVNGYKEYNLRDEKNFFTKFEIEFITLNDTTTEVFRKIRFKSKRELLEQGKLHQMPNEDSLSYFVRKRCKLTPFERDVVYLKDFQFEYEKFARAEKVTEPVPVTKRALEAMGSMFERMQVTALRLNGTKRINLDKAKEKSQKPLEKILAPKWFFYDFMAVALHVLMTIWLFVPLTAIPFLTEAMHYQVSARDSEELITFTDLKYTWWNIPGKMFDMPTVFLLLIILSFCILGLGLAQLILYYLMQNFPIKVETLLAGVSGFKSIPKKVFYALALFLIGVICMAIVTGLCWYILGAVLNPDVFLPYAAAAITFITFVTTQLKNINTLRTEIFKKVKQAVWEKLRGLMIDTLDGIVSGIELNKGNVQVLSRENRALELFSKTPLGSIAESIGVDHKLASALAQGEEAALAALAEKFGVHPLIVDGVLAAIKKDQHKLIDIVGKLAQVPGVDIPPEIAKMIVNLSWKQTDVNVSSAVKTATIQFAKVKKELTGGAGGFNLDPRIVEALVAMSRGSVDKILNWVVSSAGVPKTIADLLYLIKGLVNGGEEDATEVFVKMMSKFMQVPPEIAKGIGALCNEGFGSKQQNNFDGLDVCIDSLCEALHIPEKFPVHIVIQQARGAQGNMQRLLESIVEFLNSKYGWKLDAQIISSLLAAVNGVKVDLDRLSVKYGFPEEMLRSVSPLFSEKKFTEIPRMGSDSQSLRETNLLSEERETEDNEGMKLSLPPSLKAWAQSQQPDQSTMEWMAKHFRLTGEQLLGLYAILRGGDKTHKSALRAISVELLRRMQIDEGYCDFMNAVVTWIASRDSESIKEAQAMLKMHYRDLTFVAKGLLDPRDLPVGYMIKHLGFRKEDLLVKRRRLLTWAENPSGCRDWCKATAIKVSDIKSLPQNKRLMARGQLMLAVQYPHLYVKRILESKLKCDEEGLRKVKSLLSPSFLPMMHLNRRKDVVMNVARLFEIEPPLMDAWIGMVLENNFEAKIGHMKKWAEKLGIENLEGLERFLQDFCNQSELFFKAVLGFRKLSKTVGLPKSFINTLAPGMSENLSSYPEIFRDFVKVFSKELGVKNIPLQESIVNFVTGKVSDLEPLGKALGLRPHSITSLLTLFGNLSPKKILEKAGQLFDILGVDDSLHTTAKTLLAICLRTNTTFRINKGITGPSKTKASLVLEELTGIHHLLTGGLIAASNLDYDSMANTIVEMAKLRHAGFRLEESHCRGMISMSQGLVNNVEDICASIKFDPDIAELLVRVSGSSNLNITWMKSSSVFQKTILKLGLDDGRTAAVLAMTREDIQNYEDIAQELDENGSIHPSFIQALLVIFEFCHHNSKWPAGYDPVKKTKNMRESIKWLCRLLGIQNVMGATLIMRLVQGDAGALGLVFSKLGWTGLERAYYASLACLVNQVPFQSQFDSKAQFAWMSFKHLDSVVGNLSSLFKISPKVLELIIKAARYDSGALAWMRNVAGFSTIKDTVKFMDELISQEAVESEEDDQDFEYLEDDNMSMSGSETTSQYSEGEESSVTDLTLVMQGDLVEKDDDETKQRRLQDLVEALNAKSGEEHRKIDSDEVKFFLSLAQGRTDQLGSLQMYLNTIYEGDPPISFVTAKEIIAISSGKIEAVKDLNGTDLLYGLDQEDALKQDEEDLESSVLHFFGFSPEDPELQLIIRLAAGDYTCWDIKNDNGQFFSNRIHPNLKLIKAITALCAKDPHGVPETLEALSNYLELDNEMILILVMISLNAVDKLPAGIVPLAQRLEVDSAVSAAFIPSCYKNTESLEIALQPMCERLTAAPTNPTIVAAVFQAMRGDLNAWVNLGIYFLGIHRDQDKENNEVLLALRAVEQILSGKIQTELKESMLKASPDSREPEILAGGEGDIEMVPIGDFVNKQRMVLLKKLGFDKFINNPVLRRVIKPENRAQAAGIMMDLILGISKKDTEVVPLVLSFIGEGAKQNELLKALVSLFNGNSSAVVSATDTIEEYLENTGVELPPGVLQAIIGAVKKFPVVMARGVTRAAKKIMEAHTSWGSAYTEGIPDLLLSIMSRKLDDDYEEYLEAMVPFVEKLIKKKSSPDDPAFKMLMLFIMGELKQFITLAAKEFGLPEQGLKEIMSLSTIKNPLNMGSFPWVTSKIHEMVPQVPKDVLEALIKLLGNKEEDLDAGRQGMGTTLYKVMNHVISMLPKQYRLAGLSSDDVLDSDLDLGECPEVKILDSFFLVCTDPHKYKNSVLAAMPNLGRALMPEVAPDALNLLTGLVSLFQSDNNPEGRERAILKLAAAFGIEDAIVKGLVSLSKGDWMGLAEMASRFCEFDPAKIQQLVQVVKRLKIISDSEEKMDELDDKNSLKRLKEKIDAGGDVEQIFHMLDADGSGSLDFEEFSEVMKFFDLQFSQQRLLEIFSKFDEDGSASMNVQEFDNAVNFIKSQISDGAMDYLGLSKNKLLAVFAVSVSLLLFLFAFIFLGIIGFISASQFGTVVNSMLPLSSGGVLSKLRSPGNIDSKFGEIKEKILKVLNVLTINDL